MGLELNPKKTQITHTLDHHEGRVGFNFLGFNVRQYHVGKYHAWKDKWGNSNGYKTIIKPSKEKIKQHIKEVRSIVQSHKTAPQSGLIRKLNQTIRGWCNYYASSVSSTAYRNAYFLTHQKLRAWARRRNSKGNAKARNKYWRKVGNDNWTFASKDGAVLFKHTKTKIFRHVKVKGNNSPYDGNWAYWATRTGEHPEIPKKTALLLKQQKGKCWHCGLYFTQESLMEIHHRDKNHRNNRWDNLKLVHLHCHDQIHGSKKHGVSLKELEDEWLENLPF